MADKLTKLDALEELASRLKAKQDETDSAIAKKAPISHAVAATTYGQGTGTNYGHVKLSDATNGTAAAASGGTAATPKAVADALAAAKTYTDGLLAANDAMVFKGTLGTGGSVTALPTSGYQAGWTYRVITAGTYAGVKCEVGDLIIAVKDYATATANTDWTVVQTNIDGAVTGPASSTDNHVAIFSGAGGKTIKDSGFTIGTSVPAGAVFTDTKYTHPSHTAHASDLYKVTVDALGHVSAAVKATQSDIRTLADIAVATDAEVDTMLDKYYPTE